MSAILSWLAAAGSCLYSAWTKIIKFLRRRVTGRGELEALLGSSPRVQDVYLRFEAYVRRSAGLESVRAAILAGVDDEEGVRALATDIIALKRINTATPRFNARVLPHLLSVLRMAGYHGRVEAMASSLSGTPYSSETPAHERMLEELWALVFPDEALPARLGDHWGRLGFQGRDPATDFRGAGLLGLHALLHLARGYAVPFRAILADTDLPTRGYPLAIAHIRVVHYMLHRLSARMLVLRPDEAVDGVGSANILTPFLDDCAYLLFVLDDVWRAERAATVMDFPRVFAAFERQLLAACTSNGARALTPPSRLAAADAAMRSPPRLTRGTPERKARGRAALAGRRVAAAASGASPAAPAPAAAVQTISPARSAMLPASRDAALYESSASMSGDVDGDGGRDIFSGGGGGGGGSASSRRADASFRNPLLHANSVHR